MADDEWSQFPQVGGTAVAEEDPFAAFPAAAPAQTVAPTVPVKPTSLRESIGQILGKAQSIGKEAFSELLPPEIMQTVFGGTTSGMRPAETSGPLISPENATALAGELPALLGGQTPLGQGLSEGTAGAISEFSKPGALLSLPTFAVPGVAETYTANVLASIPAQYRQLRDTIEQHGVFSQETGKALAESGIQDLTALLAGKASVAGRSLSASLKNALGERAPAVPEPIAGDQRAMVPIEQIPAEPITPKEVRPNEAQIEAQIQETQTNARGDGLLTEPVPSVQPAAVPPRLEGPALVDTEGNIIAQGKLGETHQDLLTREMAGPNAEKALEAFMNDAQHAFVDNSGNPLSREQAAPVGIAAGQLPEGTTKVQSQMLKPEAAPNEAISSTAGAGEIGPGTAGGEIVGAQDGSLASAPVPVDVAGPAGAKATGAKSFQIPHEPLGVPDIVDVLAENGGIKSRRSASSADADLWNDQPDLRGIYRQLLGGKLAPDQMAAIAAEHGFGDGTVGSMWQELDKAVQARRSLRTQTLAQGKLESAANTKDKAFARDILAPKETRQAINTSNMQVGDTMTVGEHQFKVTDIDPDTLDVTLEDGKKYGVQQVKDGQAVYVNKAHLVPREQDTFGPVTPESPPKGTAAVAQRIVNAEESFVEFAQKTGDLTRDQALVALAEYRKSKAIKIDPIGGQYSFTHGGFAERDVLRRAAGLPDEASLPTLRPGENQGDLLSKQTEDLTLVGEKGTDFAQRSADQAAANAARVEAEVLRDKQQGLLEIMSPGPGAAARTEPLASYELRRFGQRFQEDQTIDPAIREATGNRYYEPISNKVSVAEAEGIIEKRGTDESIRLVRDEAFPMPPRVRVTVGEALIKKLNQSHQEAKAMGNEVHADEFLNQAVDTAEYLGELGTTLGQGVQAFAIWNKLTPEGRLLEATRIAKKSGKNLTPEQTKKISELNAAIEKAPEGFQKNEKTQDLLSFMADIKGVNPGDIPTALWYSNILSGFTTQLVNSVDTAGNVFADSSALAAIEPAGVPNLVAGLYQGMIKGGFEAASVLKTGRSITGDKISQQRILERVQFGKKGGVPIDPSTRIGRFMKSAFESKVATPLNLWKYPLRAMIASDTVFFNSMKEARARFLARGIAKKEGLSGQALFKRVEEVLNQSPETLDAALKQAQDEGLTGLNQRRRVSEIIEQGRSSELVADANEAAAIATYNHDPSGVLGLVAHNIANITTGFPLGKAIVPFTRIVANVANRGLNYTPWGYKRAFFGEWGGKGFATEPPVGDAFRAQLAKATLGTTAMTAVALLDANDTIQVTAKGPADREERKQWLNTGAKPYSIRVGDTFYSYQYTPFQLGFAMIGHYRDAIRYNKLSEKDASTRLAYAALKSGSTLFDMSFLSGVSDFIGTLQGETSSIKGASRLFSRTTSSVVIPNLVKQIDKLFDPTIYQADTITQSLIRETPIARGALLKPMLNVLGEPIKPSSNRFFTFDTKDPVWKFIVEKQAFVPVPSKTTKIGDRPITADEYYRLIQESGPMIREYISSNLGRLNEMNGGDAQDDIRKQSQQFRDVVKSRF